jgi:ABC-type transport system substrate-binding protein
VIRLGQLTPAGIACALILSIFQGCSEPLPAPIPAEHPSDATPRRGGTMRLSSFGDIRSLDPHAVSNALDSAVLELMFAGLVDFDRSGNVVPDLASRWEVGDEGKTYRFFLHEGARFHDGGEVTADDVKRSIERALHPDTPNSYGSLFEGIVGYKDYTEKKSPSLSGVVVEGRYVVSIRLAEPDATFLTTLGLHALRPVCKSAGNRYSDSWHPCGAGPFKLMPGAWDRGRGITVVRHEGYYKKDQPYLDAVSWTYNMALQTEKYKFVRGELDALREFQQPDLVAFSTDTRWKPLGVFEPEVDIEGQSMNTEMPPFDNVEVRRAVAAAIDRDQIELLKATQMRKTTQVIPSGVPLHDPAFQGQKHDLAAALEHMRRAGLAYDPATGEGGWPHPIHVYVYKQGLYEYVEQVVQQQLARIGLRLELHVVSFPTYLALARRRGKTALSPQGWKQDYPDASDFFEPLFGSKAVNDDDSNNTAFYKNPTLDAILEQAHKELDPSRRKALYGEANRIVCDDAPWAFTHSMRWYTIMQPYVRNYVPNAVWTHDVREAWLDGGRKLAMRAGGPLARDALAFVGGAR